MELDVVSEADFRELKDRFQSLPSRAVKPPALAVGI